MTGTKWRGWAGAAAMLCPALLCACDGSAPPDEVVPARFGPPTLVRGIAEPVAPPADDDPEPDCEPGRFFCERATRTGLGADGPAYGRGAAWVDVDGDGWEDLWQTDTGSAAEWHVRTSRLHRNRGDRTFERVDLGIAVEDMRSNWTGTWGDVDRDGDPDLFLVNGGYSGVVDCALYRNDFATSGTFTDITAEAGIDAAPNDWWSAAFADANLDGWLDLVVTAISGRIAYYENMGDGTFVELGREVGLVDLMGDTKNPLWFDFDRDGDQDLFVAGRGDMRLFENDRSEGFRDVTLQLLGQSGGSPPVFAAAAWDIDQDGWEDLYLGRWTSQDQILINQRGVGFRVLPDSGIHKDSRVQAVENTMGLTVGDLDADGWPEVLIGTGMPEAPGFPIVFCHQGLPVSFVRCGDDFVAGQGRSRNHAAVLGDPDHDGDVDVFWNLGGHVEWDERTGDDTSQWAAYYEQVRPPARNTVVVHLVGTQSNTDAIGAHLVVAGAESHEVDLHNMQGFPGQASSWMVLPLGDSPDGNVTVTWPSGIVTETRVRAGGRVTILEPPR